MESWRELPLILIAAAGTTTWKDLPTVLKTDILSRLPVKTLITSTAVSKSWFTLIKRPSFISKHINRSINNTPTESLLFAPILSHTFTLITLNNQQTKLQLPFLTDSNSIIIIGSCHGLICIADTSPKKFGGDLYLWNPLLRKHKHIPTTRSCLFTLSNDLTKTTRAKAVIAFGFHKPHNDYRILRILYCADTARNFFGKVPPKVEIYSLGKDSWRKLDVGDTITRHAKYDHWAFVNDVVYWMELNGGNSPNWVLSFDFNEEVFGEVKLPTTFKEGVGPEANAMLCDYKGLLGLCVFDLSPDYGLCERLSVWARKEDPKLCMVWVKQFKVILKDLIYAWPLMFTKSGELIMQSLDFGPTGGGGPTGDDLTVLQSYNFEKMRYKNLANDGPYTVDTSFVESLLLFEEQKPRFRTASILQ